MARQRRPILRPFTGLPELHPKLPEPWRRICALARSGELEDARAAFAKEIGYPVDDKRIKQARHDCLTAALASGSDTVALPLYLAVAEWLDERSGVRSPGHQRKLRREQLIFKLHQRANEYRRKGLPAGKADYKAATEYKESAKEFATKKKDPVEWALDQLKHLPRVRVE
jgi:hypothetical protein